jgi:hypothetical protein
MLEFLDTSLIRNTALPRYDSTASLHPVRLAPGPDMPFDKIAYSTVGGFSNVWNGAGLGTVHSRPVGAIPRLVARLFKLATAAVRRQCDRKQEVHLRQAEAKRADRR